MADELIGRGILELVLATKKAEEQLAAFQAKVKDTFASGKVSVSFEKGSLDEITSALNKASTASAKAFVSGIKATLPKALDSIAVKFAKSFTKAVASELGKAAKSGSQRRRPSDAPEPADPQATPRSPRPRRTQAPPQPQEPLRLEDKSGLTQKAIDAAAEEQLLKTYERRARALADIELALQNAKSKHAAALEQSRHQQAMKNVKTEYDLAIEMLERLERTSQQFVSNFGPLPSPKDRALALLSPLASQRPDVSATSRQQEDAEFLDTRESRAKAGMGAGDLRLANASSAIEKGISSSYQETLQSLLNQIQARQPGLVDTSGFRDALQSYTLLHADLQQQLTNDRNSIEAANASTQSALNVGDLTSPTDQRQPIRHFQNVLPQQGVESSLSIKAEEIARQHQDALKLFYTQNALHNKELEAAANAILAARERDIRESNVGAQTPISFMSERDEPIPVGAESYAERKSRRQARGAASRKHREAMSPVSSQPTAAQKAAEKAAEKIERKLQAAAKSTRQATRNMADFERKVAAVGKRINLEDVLSPKALSTNLGLLQKRVSKTFTYMKTDAIRTGRLISTSPMFTPGRFDKMPKRAQVAFHLILGASVNFGKQLTKNTDMAVRAAGRAFQKLPAAFNNIRPLVQSAASKLASLVSSAFFSLPRFIRRPLLQIGVAVSLAAQKMAPSFRVAARLSGAAIKTILPIAQSAMKGVVNAISSGAKGFVSALRAGLKTAGGLFRSWHNTTSKSTSSMFAQLTASVAAGNLLARGISKISAGIFSGIGAGIELFMTMEQLNATFTHLLGNADEAKTMLKTLFDLSVDTPLDYPSIMKGATALLATGRVAKNEIIPTLEAMADAAAGSIKGFEAFEPIIIALSQMMNRGKIQAQELNQLANAGLPAYALLQRATGFDSAKLTSMGEKGQIGLEYMPAFIKEIGDSYKGLAAIQSATLPGLVAKFKEQFASVSRDIQEPLLVYGKKLLAATTSWLKTDQAKAFIQTMKTAVATVVSFVEALASNPIVRSLAGIAALSSAFAGVALIVGSLAGLAATALSPFAAAMAAIGTAAFSAYQSIKLAFQSTYADAMMQKLTKIRQIFFEIFTNINEQLAPVMGKLFGEKSKSKAGEFWDAVLAKIQNALDIISALTVDLPQGFETIKAAINVVTAYLNDRFTHFFEQRLPGLIDGTASGFLAAFTELGANWLSIFEAVAKGIGTIFDSLFAAIEDRLKASVARYKKVGDLIAKGDYSRAVLETVFPSAHGGTAGTAQKMAGGSIKAFTQFTEDTKEIFNNAAQKFKDAFNLSTARRDGFKLSSETEARITKFNEELAKSKSLLVAARARRVPTSVTEAAIPVEKFGKALFGGEAPDIEMPEEGNARTSPGYSFTDIPSLWQTIQQSLFEDPIASASLEESKKHTEILTGISDKLGPAKTGGATGGVSAPTTPLGSASDFARLAAHGAMTSSMAEFSELTGIAPAASEAFAASAQPDVFGLLGQERKAADFEAFRKKRATYEEYEARRRRRAGIDGPDPVMGVSGLGTASRGFAFGAGALPLPDLNIGLAEELTKQIASDEVNAINWEKLIGDVNLPHAFDILEQPLAEMPASEPAIQPVFDNPFELPNVETLDMLSPGASPLEIPPPIKMGPRTSIENDFDVMSSIARTRDRIAASKRIRTQAQELAEDVAGRQPLTLQGENRERATNFGVHSLIEGSPASKIGGLIEKQLQNQSNALPLGDVGLDFQGMNFFDQIGIPEANTRVPEFLRNQKFMPSPTKPPSEWMQNPYFANPFKGISTPPIGVDKGSTAGDKLLEETKKQNDKLDNLNTTTRKSGDKVAASQGFAE